MAQVPILNGIYTDGVGDFRTSYPRNMVPVPKAQGISEGYLRPADGIVQVGTGQGADRGGIAWNDQLYRVSGSRLIRQADNGSTADIGEVGDDGKPCRLVYSFDSLAVASTGSLYYWDGVKFQRVVDPDLGTCRDVCFIDGYFAFTDGEFIGVTDLTNKLSVNPLKYGSAETDPDEVMAVVELRNELGALGRYTMEWFRNVGGTGFPFAQIDGAQVPKGVIGTHAWAKFIGSIAFVGSGRNEAPAVYVMLPGDAQKISTREVDTILAQYTEAQLSATVMETRVDKGHNQVLIHLPDRCLVYDANASKVLGEPAWHTLDSGGVAPARYRARGLVWCYDRWNVGDPTSSALGRLTDTLGSHYGQAIGWDFGVGIVYLEGNDGIVHDIELIGLPGRCAFGADPTVWTSYSSDGVTWSQERAIRVGRQGQRDKRMAWRTQGRIRHFRMQRFRGTSDAMLSVARLEAQIEPLRIKG